MKIDFTQSLLTLEGEPLEFVERSEDGKLEKTQADLRTVCIRALLAPATHQKAKPEEKLKHGLLAQGIYSNDELDLKAEEITEIKRLVGELYPPLIVMRAYGLLDPSEVDA